MTGVCVARHTRTKQSESYCLEHLFEEAIMSQHWNEKAAERALQSPLKDYEHRDLSKAYRFSLHGLHFGLLPDERVGAKWQS